MSDSYSKIKEICKQKGISISQVEKACGLSSGSLIKWKTASPILMNLYKVAYYLDVPMSKIYDFNVTIFGQQENISPKSWDEYEELNKNIKDSIKKLTFDQRKRLYSFIQELISESSKKDDA